MQEVYVSLYGVEETTKVCRQPGSHTHRRTAFFKKCANAEFKEGTSIPKFL